MATTAAADAMMITDFVLLVLVVGAMALAVGVDIAAVVSWVWGKMERR